MSEPDHDELIAAVVAELRRPVTLSDGFDDRVMRVVRTSRHEGRVLTAMRWMVEPRAVRVSPAGALATAAGLAGLILVSGHVLQPSESIAPPPVVAPAQSGSFRTAAAGAAREAVQFVLTAPGASQVSLVGDFNDWDPDAMPLRATADGEVWSVTVPLAPGRHEYAFVVDGTRWVPDPAAPPSPGADFGAPNSVVTVGAAL